jgi:hypothetical protein|tara:strand:- start:3316 stop:3933 length:618 start_codon:yes stop_codon:yes gene_type:complete
MAIRKNKKRIDPRYFLHETTYRDEIDEATLSEFENVRSTGDVMSGMANTHDDLLAAIVKNSNGQDRLGGDERKVKAHIATCKDQELKGENTFVKCMLMHNTWYSNALRAVGMIPQQKVDEGFTTNMPDNIPSTAQVMQQMAGQPDEEQGSFSTTGPDRQAALTTDDLFKLFNAGINPADLRDVDNNNLTPEMASILGRSGSGAGY